MDQALKNFFHKEERFADLLNAVLAGGSEEIRPGDVKWLHTTKPVKPDHKSRLGTESQLEVDLSARVEVTNTGQGAYVFVVNSENQAYQDRTMVFRSEMSELSDYFRQIRDLKDGHHKKRDLSGDELLAGINAKDVIWPVITIVLYFGKEPWTAPVSRREAVNGPDWLKNNISDWPMHLVHVLEEKLIFHNEANRDLFWMLHRKTEIGDPVEAMMQVMQRAAELGAASDVVQTAEAILGRKLIPRTTKKGEKDMHGLVLEYGNALKSEGKAEGIIETARIFGADDSAISSLLAKKLNITIEEALDKIKQFDTPAPS